MQGTGSAALIQDTDFSRNSGDMKGADSAIIRIIDGFAEIQRVELNKNFDFWVRHRVVCIYNENYHDQRFGLTSLWNF